MWSRISFFAVPILGESQGTKYLSQILRDPEGIIDQLASDQHSLIPSTSSLGPEPISSQALADARTRMYENIVSESTRIDARTRLYGE